MLISTRDVQRVFPGLLKENSLPQSNTQQKPPLPLQQRLAAQKNKSTDYLPSQQNPLRRSSNTRTLGPQNPLRRT